MCVARQFAYLLLICARKYSEASIIVITSTISRLQRSFASQAIDVAIAQASKKMTRPEQLEAVENFVLGRDIFLSLPTGRGKSFCFAYSQCTLRPPEVHTL